jgi:hypothetical protein
MSKRVLFTLFAVVLAVGLAVPMAAPVGAAPDTMTVVSDTNTMVTEINNVDITDQNAVLCWVHPGWWGRLTWSGWSSAQWIWDTYLSDDPIQSPSASITGRVVRFERTFDISGTPTAGTLHIAVDNGYEVWLNGQFVGTDNVWPLPPGDLSWRTSELKQENVDWTNWQTVGNYDVSGLLQNGTNTLVIIAGNEYMYTDDTMPSGTSWPRTGGSAEPVGNNSNNPGGVVFQLDIEYEAFVPAPEITVVKEATKVNGAPIGDPKEAHEGDIITYEYTVTNTGNVPLYDVELWDDNFTPGDPLDDVQITLSGLTDEDADTYLDDLAVSASATGTRDYTVPCFTLGPVENEATASGWYDGVEYTDTDDESVDILHNPDIEVTKSGPDPIGYFNSLNAHYEYTVKNIGDACLDNVTLIDDMVGTPVLVDDGDGDEYLSPGETWGYEADFLLECTGDTITVFTNKATGSGTDVEGTVVEDFACWNVVVFQWLPRTIGYWGNWDNHWSPGCMTLLVAGVNEDSTYFSEVQLLAVANVHDLLLASTPTGKMTVAKATALLKKQLLGAWLNVVSYNMGAADTCGSLDAAMDPGATVYLTESSCNSAVALFGETATVQEILDEIEGNIGSWSINDLLTAQCVLDWLNNGGEKGYTPFMDPEFDASECPSCKGAIIYGTERGGNNLGPLVARTTPTAMRSMQLTIACTTQIPKARPRNSTSTTSPVPKP